MSIQNILLSSDPNEFGLYDAELHSCQIYKTPALPTDVIREQDIAPLPAVKFINAIEMNNLTPTLPFLTVTTTSVYTLTGNFPVADYVCVGVGFSNDRNENVRGFSPGIQGGFCAIRYFRTSEVINTLGTDNIWAWVIPRTAFSFIDAGFM